MKQNLIKLIAIVSLIVLNSCGNNVNLGREKPIQHELRKFNVKTKTSETSSGWYFIVAGGYSSNNTELTTVRFYFKNCHNEYQFLEVPLERVRVQIDNTIKEPFVKFNVPSDAQCFDLYFDCCVSSVTIYCKESDFQPEININDLR